VSAGSATVGLIRDACVTSALILFLLGAASVFSQAIVRMNVPGMLTDLLSSVGGKLAFLIVTTLGLIVIGSLTEGVPALFIFARSSCPSQRRPASTSDRVRRLPAAFWRRH